MLATVDLATGTRIEIVLWEYHVALVHVGNLVTVSYTFFLFLILMPLNRVDAVSRFTRVLFSRTGFTASCVGTNMACYLWEERVGVCMVRVFTRSFSEDLSILWRQVWVIGHGLVSPDKMLTSGDCSSVFHSSTFLRCRERPCICHSPQLVPPLVSVLDLLLKIRVYSFNMSTMKSWCEVQSCFTDWGRFNLLMKFSFSEMKGRFPFSWCRLLLSYDDYFMFNL